MDPAQRPAAPAARVRATKRGAHIPMNRDLGTGKIYYPVNRSIDTQPYRTRAVKNPSRHVVAREKATLHHPFNYYTLTHHCKIHMIQFVARCLLQQALLDFFALWLGLTIVAVPGSREGNHWQCLGGGGQAPHPAG